MDLNREIENKTIMKLGLFVLLGTIILSYSLYLLKGEEIENLIYILYILGIPTSTFMIIYARIKEVNSLNILKGLSKKKLISYSVLILISSFILGPITIFDDATVFLISIPIATILIIYSMFKKPTSFLGILLTIILFGLFLLILFALGFELFVTF